MLVLTRRVGQAIKINDDITVTILKVGNEFNATQVRVGIEAPDKVVVHREEIYNKIKTNEDKK